MRDKSTVLIVIALGCGLVASVVVSRRVEQGRSSIPDFQIAPVLVAAADIDVGEELTAGNVKLEHWPLPRIPAGAVPDLGRLLGSLPRTRIAAGEAFVTGQLQHEVPVAPPAIRAEPPAADLEAAAAVEATVTADAELDFVAEMDLAGAWEGYRVDGVPVVLAEPTTSRLLPGDRVDLVADMARGGAIPHMLTRTTLWDVEIVEVAPRWEQALDRDGSVRGWHGTVSLRVQRDQVEPLLLARSLGRLQVTADRSTTADERIAAYQLGRPVRVSR